jgi:tryptophan synthase alpha chain
VSTSGTERIRRAFDAATQKGRSALITYLMGGDPGPGRCAPYLRALADAGVDILEVGIPFSDPVADGPTIQAAAVRARRAGTRTTDVLAEIKGLRDEGVDTPVVVMTYANIPYTMGYDAFAKALATHGIDGAIIPDIPVDEAEPFRVAMNAHGRAHVLLAAPLTKGERLERITRTTDGFLYLIGSFGTTGARDRLAPETLDVLAEACPVARAAGVPIAVGFGVSTPEQVQGLVDGGADGIVVGSALVAMVGEGKTPEALQDAVHRLSEGLVRRGRQ